MKSMTGYGTSGSHSARADIEVTFKCVNGRYSDIRIHAPKEYSGFEADLRSRVKKVFLRGTLDVYIVRRPQAKAMQSTFKVNWDLAKQLKLISDKMCADLKMESHSDLSLFLRHSDIVQVEESSVVDASEKKQLLSTVEKSLIALDKERLREGKALSKDLARYQKELVSLLAKMRRARTVATGEIKKRLTDRIDQIRQQVAVSEERLAQEIAILVDKSDIAEEMQRLAEHLSAFKTEMGKTGSIGKKLDFFTQEFLREINTIGSKSQNAPLTRLVVEAKSVVEKMREQVQNIE